MAGWRNRSPAWAPSGFGINGFTQSLPYTGRRNWERSLPRGPGSGGIIRGVAPYWRVAIQHQWTGKYLEAGTYGLAAGLFFDGISGLTDRYTDLAFDLQYEQDFSGMVAIAHSTFIHEHRTMEATAEQGIIDNAMLNLNTFRVDGTLVVKASYALTLGYFMTEGDLSPGLYGGQGIYGSASGDPWSNGLTGQISYLLWDNVKLALQYTAYSSFNGASDNYDGAGRKASDNNTRYLLVWFNF